MKTSVRKLPLAATLAFFLTLTLAALAQDKAAPAPEEKAPADQAPAAAPAPTTPPAAPAPAAAPSDSVQPAPMPAPSPAASPAPAIAPAPEKSGLRRLDEPAAPPAEKAEAAGDNDDEKVAADEAPKADADKAAPEKPDKKPGHKYRSYGYNSRHNSGSERVNIGGDSTLAEGESADAVVSVFGSSTSHGKVGDAVVSVLGSSTASGEIGGAVVSVLGSSRFTGGKVGDAVVSVLGNTYINGEVQGEAVAVLGNVELGPDAIVHGDVVCVGGAVSRDPKSVLHGQIHNVAFAGHVGGVEWLHAWITKCALFARPLAFGEHLMWAWWIALGFLGFYTLVALIFSRGVVKCAETFEQRPGASFLTALLMVLLTPVVIILLCVTVVGIALVPFIAAGLFIATIFGKVVMLTWLGRRVTKLLGEGAWSHAAIATLIGGAIVLLLYTVPVLGFIIYKLLGLLGLGVVVLTLTANSKRKPAPPAAPVSATPVSGVPPAVAPAPVAPAPTVSSGFVGSTPAAPAAAAGIVAAAAATGAESIATPVAPAPAAESAVPPLAAAPLPPPVAHAAPSPVVSALTLPRAGLWIRLGASAIDAILVGITLGFLPHLLKPNYLLLYAGYCVVMWALKGTTIGGIVCNLKVVRLDDRPVDWMTAIVRALAGFLSFFPAGLGFIWIHFDDQKQSWHDKIAGTAVVVVPKGMPLI